MFANLKQNFKLSFETRFEDKFSCFIIKNDNFINKNVLQGVIKSDVETMNAIIPSIRMTIADVEKSISIYGLDSLKQNLVSKRVLELSLVVFD